MTHENELPMAMWVIPCFDKRKEKPLPVYNRTFFLDWSQLSTNEVAEVLDIMTDKSSESKHSPVGFDTAIVTMTRKHDAPDWRMLKFRQHFVEPTESEREELFQQAQQGRRDFKSVQLNAEYFEDENGNAITKYEMNQHVSGQENPIIVGDYKSINRLGPIAPKATGEWDQKKAETIAHFLDVVRRITASSWYRSPPSITYRTSRESEKEEELTDPILLEALFPNDEQTTAILGYFRQLHAGDKLLVNACDTYIAHCGDGRKAWWIEERKQAFENMVDAVPAPFQVGFTRREIVRMFMYGARLLHATSNHGDDQKLADLIKAHGRHNAVAVFNHCLWDLLGIAAPVYNVIRQDYDSWITNHGLEGPGRDDIDTLFQSKTD